MNDKPTVLIVDDNKANIDILLDILNSYDLIPTLDGETALNIVKTEDIDLILLDIMMPSINGFEVCRRLKENHNTSKIPVIFLTSKDNMSDIKHGFELGAVDYITKPFNPIELKVRINTHLELRSYQQDLEQKIKQELKEKKLKEQIMFQQSKQADMGELLMHISHQWKQPLSELGSITAYNIALLKNEDENLKENLKNNFNQSETILNFMSQTVLTFQDFYKPNKMDSFFYVETAINNAINMISATFDFEDITLKVKKEHNLKIYGNTNEYSQVILAVLNNAKDIFKLREISSRKVDINITKTIVNGKNKSCVIIEDNAKGISLDNKDDIFLPFVSERNSVGMGLYMAKIICEKNSGTIKVLNTNKGVKFTIIL